jgi:competence protein ComEA
LAAILSGSLVGVLIFAIALIWRGARGETIVLQVQAVDDPNIVRVYVGGEVVSPGLYTLPRSSRVADAIELAGNVTTIGDTSGLGMAAVLQDADQIIVPARQVIVAPTGAPPVTGGPGPSATHPPRSGVTPININTASASELDTLPGIGPALSARIIEHRESNGPFQTVDELEAVSGISERMVNEMRALITIGP